MAVDERGDGSRAALRAAAHLRRPRSSRTSKGASRDRDFDLNVAPAAVEHEALVSCQEEQERQEIHRHEAQPDGGIEVPQQEVASKRRKHRPKVVALVPTGTSTTPSPSKPKPRPKPRSGGARPENNARPRKRRKQEVFLSQSVPIGSEAGGLGFTVQIRGPLHQQIVSEQSVLVERSVLVEQQRQLVVDVEQSKQRQEEEEEIDQEFPWHKQFLQLQQAQGGKARKNKAQMQSVEQGVEVLARLLERLMLKDNSSLSLVPFVGAGAVVPASNIKKKKPRAKVQLDPESTRVWKLLMANEGESDETTKNWEKERQDMKQKALCFIEKMHLIQGNRKFSKWKGSVVDSVIGAFLTQNVSDHLSSSAFMAMASRFPVKNQPDATCSSCSCEREHCCTAQDDVRSQCKHKEVVCVEGEEEEVFMEGRRKVRRALFTKHDKEQPPSVDDEEQLPSVDDREQPPSVDDKEQPPNVDEEETADQQPGDDLSSSSNSSCLTEVSVAATITTCASTTALSHGEENETKASNKRSRKETTVTGKERALLEHTRGSTKKSYDWESIKSKVTSRGPNAPKPEDSADWHAVRLAETKEVADVIKERGMNNILAGRMKGFLDRVYEEHGSIDLEWIRDVPPQDAKDFLLSIRGLGLKSVECIRLLALDHLAFPVDTNVGRILVRLGWVPIQPLPEELELHLLELYPVQETVQKYVWPRLCTLDRLTLYELHYQMITFGKVFCTKTRPNCNACPMRMECRHFASAYASARLALPAPPTQCEQQGDKAGAQQQEVLTLPPPVSLPPATLTNVVATPKKCEPIIEEPRSPEPEPESESCEGSSTCPDMEDLLFTQGSETLHLNLIEQPQAPPQYTVASASSKELMVLPPEFAYIPVPKLKNIFRLRTVHYVYELPDHHPLVQQLEPREKDDPCFYLLALWSQDEQPQNSQLENQQRVDDEFVKGTLLIPCRTAMRGSFPLNGTYFQVNEVFADSETGNFPLNVSRSLLWNLHRKFVYFGTSVPAIFRGLTADEVQACFWKGYVCVRGFDRKSRSPRPLAARLHIAPSNRKGQPIFNDGDD
ncbi:protein ROS1 [Selaginella moellendorffii]|nr:protein ROS1 [Selaginella moellendorffii]|eukprot:XP_002986643.2 protein ROS1 [Selaginella moellendorffii]